MKNTKNSEMAKLLFVMGTLLEEKEGQEFKAESYRRASIAIENLPKEISSFSTREEIDDIKYIGEVISKEVFNYLKYKTFPRLEDLLDESDPADIFCLVEGIGAKTAERIIETLNLRNFDDVLKSFVDKKIKYVLEPESNEYKNLEEMLSILPSWYSRSKSEEAYFSDHKIDADDLLGLDVFFRTKYPYLTNMYGVKKFYTDHGNYEVSYSHSESATDNNGEGDWVNLRLNRNGHKKQWTVLTCRYGKLKGERIVMGAEKESSLFYKKIS